MLHSVERRKRRAAPIQWHWGIPVDSGMSAQCPVMGNLRNGRCWVNGRRLNTSPAGAGSRSRRRHRRRQSLLDQDVADGAAVGGEPAAQPAIIAGWGAFSAGPAGAGHAGQRGAAGDELAEPLRRLSDARQPGDDDNDG